MKSKKLREQLRWWINASPMNTRENWEGIYQAFRDRHVKEDHPCGVDVSVYYDNMDKPPEPECDHRVGYIPMFKDGNVIFVYESQGIKIYKPFKNCPDCGKKL